MFYVIGSYCTILWNLWQAIIEALKMNIVNVHFNICCSNNHLEEMDISLCTFNILKMHTAEKKNSILTTLCFFWGSENLLGMCFIGQTKAKHFYKHKAEQCLIRECWERQFPPVPADMHVTNLWRDFFWENRVPSSTIPFGQYERLTWVYSTYYDLFINILRDCFLHPSLLCHCKLEYVGHGKKN